MANKQAQIENVLKDHFGKDYAFEIRGPLTVTQFEEERARSHAESAETRNRARDTDKAFTGNYTLFKGGYRDGDELYFFRSDRRSWGHLKGREGYVLIRKGEIADMIVTVVN